MASCLPAVPRARPSLSRSRASSARPREMRPNTPSVLVGSCVSSLDRAVAAERLRAVADQSVLPHCEVSVSTGENVDEIFMRLAERALEFKKKLRVLTTDELDLEINLDEEGPEQPHKCYE
eukprot:gnl/Chilomastix_cuspidata/3175.p2 GENE.gnl/Chilomastix_cuspidata/3175~~gnl/Chilomastix_cuspidata/3175.p2  ORF type:complete len:121 (-),score=15.23 gnl/Chilomastix_cuspidata/3175:146-508(-)